MQSQVVGWMRFGILITVVWMLAVSCLASYEWIGFPATTYFVEPLVAKTREPVSVIAGNQFADLVPLIPRFHMQNFLIALFVPVLALWLLGGLWFWVLAGFKRSQS